MKKALQPSANNVTVTFELPSNYQVKVVPEVIPSIYNGEKTVIYGLLMEKSEQKEESIKYKATLTGDIIGKKFKFDIPFELTEGESEEEDVSVIHQLAVKKMIQDWQDDEEPFEQRHKKDIIALSTDASVVSRYTAYIAVDVAQNKPVSGSMQSYELTASGFDCLSLSSRLALGGGGGFSPSYGASFNSLSFGATPLDLSMPLGAPLPAPLLSQHAANAPPPTMGGAYQSLSHSQLGANPRKAVGCSRAPPPPPFGANPPPPPPPAPGGGYQLSSHALPPPLIPVGGGMPQLLSSAVKNESLQMALQPAMQMLRKGQSATSTSVTKSESSPIGASFVVSLQQANGSWLLNDQLAGAVMSKSVEELKSCCPVSCDDTVMANIWATLVMIELLKKKYPSMLEELELVIMKAEQWLSKQVLPSGINLAVLKENTSKLF